jgi:hypothetical protein
MAPLRSPKGATRRESPECAWASPFGALQEERRPLGICAFLPPGSEKPDGLRKDLRWWTRDSLPSKTGERVYSSSLHHVKGELLLAQNPSDVAEAEQCFCTAIEIARRQSARIAELRGTTSLTRLLAKQGRRDEARAILAEIYGWFTEGFDTRDLKEAKALLDELTE